MLDKQENTNPFLITKRRGLIVWVYSLRQLKTLKRFGVIHYVSRKMKYVVIYLNEADVELAEKKINQLHFVRSVERSYRPDIDMNFAEKIGIKKAEVIEETVDLFDVEEANTEIVLAENV